MSAPSGSKGPRWPARALPELPSVPAAALHAADHKLRRRHPCGCGLTVTAGPDDYSREWQRRLWGTAGWAASHGRRTGVESFNAEIKQNHAAMDRGYTRVFGLTKNTLLLAFGLAGVNARMLRDWHARRLLPDPWAVEIGEPTQPAPNPQPTRRRPRRQSLHMILASRGHDPPDRRSC